MTGGDDDDTVNRAWPSSTARALLDVDDDDEALQGPHTITPDVPAPRPQTERFSVPTWERDKKRAIVEAKTLDGLAQTGGLRSAHIGISVARRYPDDMRSWPDAAIAEMLPAFARWVVKYRQPLDALHTMCSHVPEAEREHPTLAYLLYAKTVPFHHEFRWSTPVPLTNLGRVQ